MKKAHRLQVGVFISGLRLDLEIAKEMRCPSQP